MITKLHILQNIDYFVDTRYINFINSATIQFFWMITLRM
jgi:hypothetical protein